MGEGTVEMPHQKTDSKPVIEPGAERRPPKIQPMPMLDRLLFNNLLAPLALHIIQLNCIWRSSSGSAMKPPLIYELPGKVPLIHSILLASQYHEDMHFGFLLNYFEPASCSNVLVSKQKAPLPAFVLLFGILKEKNAGLP